MADAPPTRKPYRITKQREKWSDSEHQRFTEAVEKYGRDWKMIVEHVGTRSVAQSSLGQLRDDVLPSCGGPVPVRSHAQKFFLKLEKSGQAGVVPPPRPKKRAAKPYPVQDRGEERRKSKRSRSSASNSSAHSQPSQTRGAAVSPSTSPSNGRSSPRSAATAATLPVSSRRPLRSSRATRSLANAAASTKGSSQDLEGNGSNIASANESNNDHSEGPSATQENSGLSTGGADLDLQFSADPMSLEAPEAAPRPREKSETPDYGKLYSIVNVLFDSGGAANDEKNHKQMMEQLEPGQRKELLAMMDQLTGNLRSTCPPAQKLEQLKAELKAKSQSPTPPQQPPPTPIPAPARASRLDHAASMPLMPCTACLPMPQTVSEEPLALMQPLPGSQGTALLQPLPCAQQCSFSPVLPPPLASDACELVHCGSGAGSSLGSGIGCGSVAALPGLAADAVLLQQSEPEQSIAEQLLVDNSGEGAGMGQAMFDIQQGSGLEEVGLQLPKSSSLGGNTPLDTCLAQLESGTDPTVPESDDFLDSWKIGSSDPVWQTLEMQQLSPTAPTSPSSFTRDTNGSMFAL
ncbi:hypothetical protein COCSUDRAFT_59046 [Coccomyxa subellipsoidea C-169]|uniref:Uncharacterized protein n=1 Tax=Coccomyxa subellipsoidea (strain C-169) TaxID=574566 RepID=I0Z798_COCSC|nr:hypothetical protein COCSUDRAFT_59046 [Coccomyxa subellipsoidea C-169]EIE26517.1 hypothetical protein COCSUDRAFT_59046 [Coccomyxa subellipsoidea C-169]|eukprot:XP_005651061.1 hypothetical protein COCSUDRAFT_59046 [Coccomyxa subellipsoidea C-169]